MSKREIFVLLIFAVGILWGLRNQVVACCLVVWNDFFRPAGWLGYRGIFHYSIFPANHICFGVLVISLFLHPWRRRWNASAVATILLLIWVWICYLFAHYKDLAFDEAWGATTYLVPLVLISITLYSRRRQRIYLIALALSVGIHLAWSGYVGIATGQPQTEIGIRSGQMTDRNDFLVAGTACLPLLWYMAFYWVGWKERWIRWFGRGLLLSSFFAFIYGLSRGGVIGMATLALWYAFGTGRVARRAPVVVICGLLALSLLPSFVWERMSTLEVSLEEQSEGSAAARLANMKIAWELTLENPVVGVGPDNSWRMAIDRSGRDRGMEPHFFWLKGAAEYGIPFMLAFVVFVITVIVRLRRMAAVARDTQDRETEGIATALSCAIVGFLATGTFTSQFLSEYLWAILGLAGVFLVTPADEEEVVPAPEPARFEPKAAKAGRSTPVGNREGPVT